MSTYAHRTLSSPKEMIRPEKCPFCKLDGEQLQLRSGGWYCTRDRRYIWPQDVSDAESIS